VAALVTVDAGIIDVEAARNVFEEAILEDGHGGKMG